MDDDAPIRTMTAEMLNRLGYDSKSSRNGEEAIESYRSAIADGRPFDVVILDLKIRVGLDGIDTLAALRHIDPDVRAIVCSGYFNEPILADYREYGFIERLPKPYSIQELNRALHNALAADAPADPVRSGRGHPRRPPEMR
jgi:DNA-binding NtrC family response regulator